MKIKGSTENNEIPRVGDLAQQDAVRIQSSKSEAAKLAEKLKAQQLLNDTTVDKIDLGLARAINSELNPEVLSQERSNRVEKLKALVLSGQYSVPSQDVARALSQEIAFEIFSAKDSDLNK